MAGARSCAVTSAVVSLLVLDGVFFVAVASACDARASSAALPVAIVVFASFVVILGVRCYYYYDFARTLALYRSERLSLPVPVSALQPSMTTSLYGAMVVVLLTMESSTPSSTLIPIYATTTAMNVVYGIVFDDRGSMRRFVTRHVARRREQRRLFASAASAADAADVDESDDEALFDALDATRRAQAMVALKRHGRLRRQPPPVDATC